MKNKNPDLSRFLADLDPADLRQRIAELDRQRAALVVLLRAARARQPEQQPPTPTRPAEETTAAP
jgi:hypothetical protein